MAAFNSFDHLHDNFDCLMKRYADYGQQQYPQQQQHPQQHTSQPGSQSPSSPKLGPPSPSNSSTELNTIIEEKITEPIHIVNLVIQHPPSYEPDQENDKRLCTEFIRSKEVRTYEPGLKRPEHGHSKEMKSNEPGHLN